MEKMKMIDFGALFSQLLANGWGLLPLLLLAALFKSTWFKPKKGSVLFRSKLAPFANRE